MVVATTQNKGGAQSMGNMEPIGEEMKHFRTPWTIGKHHSRHLIVHNDAVF